MPQFSTEELKKIKANLPKGAINKIADEIGISIGQVSNVLNNTREDHHDIIARAVLMAKKNIAKKVKLKGKAAEVINTL